MKDHSEEARLYRERKEQAEAQLGRREPELLAMVRHFVAGAHSRKRLLSRLSPTLTSPEFEHSVRVEVQFHEPKEMFAPKPIVIALFLKEEGWDQLRAQLAVDFAASQLAPGGALARIPQRPQRDLSDTQQLLVGAGGQIRSSPFNLLRMAVERRGEIAELAARKDPLPNKFQWQGDQRPALVAARVIDVLLRDKPFSDEIFAAAAALQGPPRAEAAQLVSLIARNREELTRAIQLLPPDSPEVEWLRGLTKL